MDKLYHFGMGAAVAVAMALFHLGMMYFGPLFGMVLGSLAVGAGYELVQRLRNEGTADSLDSIATAFGGFAVAVLYEVFT